MLLPMMSLHQWLAFLGGSYGSRDKAAPDITATDITAPDVTAPDITAP